MNAQIRTTLLCDSCGKKLVSNTKGVQCKTEGCTREGIIYSHPEIKLRKA